MHRFISLLIVTFVALTLSAANHVKSQADSLYADKHYAAAAEYYALLADSVESADVFYNLGNAEYRLKHYSKAVLAYLRALRIDPGHDDSRYNLAVVRSRLSDRFVKPSEMFFVAWLSDWFSSRSVSHWVGWSVGWLVLLFIGLGFYLVGDRMWIRKSGFFVAIAFGICFVVTTAFALVQRNAYYDNAEAVITASEVEVYASPTSSSKIVTTLHSGTTVEVVGEDLPSKSKKIWVNVTLPDGRAGWVESGTFERVVLVPSN